MFSNQFRQLKGSIHKNTKFHQRSIARNEDLGIYLYRMGIKIDQFDV